MSVTAVPLQPVKRSYKVWLWLGILVAVALAFALAWWGTRSAVARHLPDSAYEQYLAMNKRQPGVQTTASGLQYMVLKSGTGGGPAEGDIALVGFEGRLRNGSIFQPKQASQGWRVGEGIPGFAEGLKLMNKGSTYRFWLPPALGYGKTPPPDSRIPPDAVLIFDVEMLDFISEAEIREMQMRQMMQQQMQQQQGGAPGGPAPEGGPPPEGAPPAGAPKQ